LIHANLSKPFVLETDAFDFTLGVILSQLKEDNLLHPVGFHSHKFSLVKINYENHDKELLAIMDAFEEWHHLLEKVQHEYFDHKNLQYFMTTRVLNRHQVRWALSLSQFRFMIPYRPRRQQGKPDALSCCSYVTLKKGDDAYDHQCDTILKPKNLWLQTLSIILKDKTFLQCIHEHLINDFLIVTIRIHRKNPPTLTNSNFMMVCYIMMDNYMYWKVMHDLKFSKPNTTH
jgi:hypothetical protein